MREVKFSPPEITKKDMEGVVNVLKSGWITSGSKTKEFEKELSFFCGTKRTKCMNSATACLEMILRVLDIRKGDQVITTPYTYAATCNVIFHVGAQPVLLDICPENLQINYDSLYNHINNRTKAIIVVDIGGILCDYDKIFEILELKKRCFEFNNKLQEKIGRIVLISDSAHSFGAFKNKKISGSIADFTVFSFHAVKNLTTAEGGAITWKEDNEELSNKIYDKLSIISLHGQNVDAYTKVNTNNWEYDILLPGFKYNMTDINAAIGLSQLKRFKNSIEKRRKIVKIYNSILSDQNVRIYQDNRKLDDSTCHLYILNLLGKNERLRNNFILKMTKRGIATNVHYKPLPMFTAYKRVGFDINDYPNSFNAYASELTLPVHNLMNESDAFYVANNLKEILNEKNC